MGFEPTCPGVDTTNDIICGETATLSLFAVVQPAVGGIVELVTGPSDAPDVHQSGRSYERELAVLAVALAAVIAGVSWHRYRRRAG